MSQEGRPYVILPAHGFLGKEMRALGKGNRSLKTLLSARSNAASCRVRRFVDFWHASYRMTLPYYAQAGIAGDLLIWWKN
jgi:hypothetical protein